MAILISRNGRPAKRLNKLPIEKESFIQEYVMTNPEVIPLYDIQDDIKLLVVAREFTVGHGRIDALGIDQYGTIYVVEAKLDKNITKREVVAQALDYGASLWRHSTDFASFRERLEQSVKNLYGGIGLYAKLAEYFHLDVDEVELLLQNLSIKLSNGLIKFVIVMDYLDEGLKDLIVYVNQNSKFDLYAVDFEYYQHEDNEIIIPKLFGAEVKKDLTPRGPSNRVLSPKNELRQLFLLALKDHLSALEAFGHLQFSPPQEGRYMQVRGIQPYLGVSLNTNAQENDIRIGFDLTEDNYAYLESNLDAVHKLLDGRLVLDKSRKSPNGNIVKKVELSDETKWEQYFSWYKSTLGFVVKDLPKYLEK